jgi:dihydroxyacetone kinase-like predicted kinase
MRRAVQRDRRLAFHHVHEVVAIGLADGEPIAGGDEFDDVAAAVIERLLAEPRDVLTLLTGADEPELEPLLARVRERHPELELDVQQGGQPHYPLLLSVE